MISSCFSSGLTFPHSSVADDRSLSLLQFEHISTVGSVGQQEVKLLTVIRTLEQRHIHTLKDKQLTCRELIKWKVTRTKNNGRKPESPLTPTANSPMSTPVCREVAVSSLAILVMKFLALLADCVCMAAQIARATWLVSADRATDGLLIIPSRTLLLVFCCAAGEKVKQLNR